tara:strand:- start:1019 stop:1933 length:915 start_codon:yes stop_codon:yes gene_type:complete
LPLSKDLPTDWSEIVLQEKFLTAIDKLSRIRFGDETLAEESTSYVLERLSEDNWKRCKTFQGRSKPSTFLISLTSNLIEEFARKKFGRLRPPVWLKQQGDLWVKIWQAICLERQMLQTVIDRFCHNAMSTSKTIQAIVVTIKSRIPACGQSSIGICNTLDGDVESLSDSLDIVSKTKQSSMKLEDQIQKSCFYLVSSVFNTSTDNFSNNMELRTQAYQFQGNKSLSDQLLKLQSELRFTSEECLLLKMVFVEGYSQSKASISIGLPPHKGGRIINNALNRMREVFQSCEFDVETLYEGLWGEQL